MKIKEKVLKDMFPNKKFIFLEKDGVSYISTDAVNIFYKEHKKKILSEVGKVINKKFKVYRGFFVGYGSEGCLKEIDRLEKDIKKELGI